MKKDIRDIRQRLNSTSSAERGSTGSLSQRAASDSIHVTTAPEAPPLLSHESPVIATQRRLSPAEVNTAMSHFYRGEVQRANTWRNRLDTTTNWAVLTAGATLSFAFGDRGSPHFVILINTVLVCFFLFMEARRYRYYEIWSSRVRLIETGYFAQILSSEATTKSDWAAILAQDLMEPHFTISEWEAVGRRLRRNYLWIFALLALSWNLKVYVHPYPAGTFDEFVLRASIGLVPGPFVLIAGLVFNVTIIIFALATVRLREATGEVLPPPREFSLPSFRQVTDWTGVSTIQRKAATVRRARRARARARARATGSLTGEWKRPEPEEMEEARR